MRYSIDVIRESMTELLARLQNEEFSTKKQLALDSGLTRQYIGLLAKGKRSPSLKTLCDIADALGCTPTELMAKLQEIMEEKISLQIAAENSKGKQYIKNTVIRKTSTEMRPPANVSRTQNTVNPDSN